VPPGQPVILLDHSPLGLAEARGQPVDLIVSGHTHNGQIFPGNLIVAQIYENAYGYKVYDALHSVVTSGVGTWGPPWRLASQSEIVLLTVSFKSS
jgi:predicted MPP superfamily phosphohydrolase